MKKILFTILIALVCGSLWGAQEFSSIPWTRSNQHQAASNTPWNPVTSTCVINTLVMNVSNAGSSWVITAKSGDGTLILYSATVTVGTTTILALPVGISLPGGLSVTFSGSAGTADFFAVYR